MSERDGLDQEGRLRRAAVTAANQQPPEPPQLPEEPEEPEGASWRSQRWEQQALWVDLQIRLAMERGDFDNLPGAGKPIRGLGETHDPDWWVKNLIEREQITAVLPAALALRKEDAELDAQLDREMTEAGVRRIITDFNQRVVEARRQLLGGPPVVTPTRDADQQVTNWRARRTERRERLRSRREQLTSPEGGTEPHPRPRRRWWHRSR